MSKNLDNEYKGFSNIYNRVIKNGREGYKGFKAYKELLDKNAWDKSSKLNLSFHFDQ